MSWDKRMAVNYAKTHAGSHSQGRCAEFTRKAIQAGGITLGILIMRKIMAQC